jgi:multiple sugar transport system permease protein
MTASALLDAPDLPDFAGLDPVTQQRVTTPKVVGNGLLTVLAILFALPLLWLILASLDAHATWSIALPHLFTLSNFTDSLTLGRGHALIVSLEMATIATVVSTVTGAFAAYAFSRRHIPWKGPLLLLVLFLSGVPINVIIIPVYQIFSQEGWLSVVPTAIFLGVTSLPFAIWIMKNFIDAVPGELEEAARIEGARTLTIMLRVVLPLAAPGIGAAAIFGFANAWGSFLPPLVLITNSAQDPASVGVFSFISSTGINYGDIAAYSIIYSLPVVILYAAMGRLFKGGFTLGGALK